MTEPERPADVAPKGPTPEEISARLEALLKRTHALRASQASQPGPSLGVTWPPPDRELDHYDVVDVPADRRTRHDAEAAPAPATAVPPVQPAPADARTTNAVPRTPEAHTTPAAALPPASAAPVADEAPGGFARPDWSELRLRGGAEEQVRSPRWLWPLTAVLALATLGQAAYIWTLAAPAGGRGRLRVDGPDGAEVRVNGQAIGPAPIEHALAPGDYAVDIVQGGAVARTERVSVDAGRTVVMVPLATAGGSAPTRPGTPATRQTAAPGTAGAAPAPPGTPAAGVAASRSGQPSPSAATAPSGGAAAAAAIAGAAVSPTRGAVLIESTPPGLPVTMEGRERGVTPITIGQLKPGRHDVLVGGLARQVDVAAGQVSTLRVARR